MRLQLTADVSSKALLDKPVTLQEGEYQIELDREEKTGLFVGITISISVGDHREVAPRVDADSITISDERSSQYHHDLIDALQHIESLGSFWAQIEEVGWRDAKIEWIPETDEEREALQLGSFEMRRPSNETPRPLRPADIRELVRFRDKNAHLVVPFSFLRVGRNEFRERRYIMAFYHFFFFLEALYGEGNVRTAALEESFKQADHFRSAIQRTLEKFATDPLHRYSLAGLEDASPESVRIKNVDKMIEHIVYMRGHLHHYSSKDQRVRGTPLTEHHFEPLAYFMMSTCFFLVPGLIHAAHADRGDKEAGSE